jgi:hypothetical protein
MPRKMQHVKGTLVPTNREAVNENTAKNIRTAAHDLRLWRIMHEELGEGGIVEIDSSVATNEPHHDILLFVNRLNSLITAEGVAELGLSGQLMITADTSDEPVVMRVTVKNNKIFYQDAHITWSVEVPFLNDH